MDKYIILHSTYNKFHINIIELFFSLPATTFEKKKTKIHTTDNPYAMSHHHQMITKLKAIIGDWNCTSDSRINIHLSCLCGKQCHLLFVEELLTTPLF